VCVCMCIVCIICCSPATTTIKLCSCCCQLCAFRTRVCEWKRVCERVSELLFSVCYSCCTVGRRQWLFV